MSNQSINTASRRHFLKQSALGAGFLILPSGTLFGQNTPNSKLNIALIGCWGRGKTHHPAAQLENVVALCDVDDTHLAKAAEIFSSAKHYKDWRECLEHPGLDAVICATTDHTHTFIANQALLRGLHVYCEKPVSISVQEARVLRATYLGTDRKLATQVGTQLHANHGYQVVKDVIRSGKIGKLQKIESWGSRQNPRDAYLPAGGEPPKSLDYDLWLGPSPYHPYNSGYFGAEVPGSNCLNWNMFWDFGMGQMGDMGSHTMDLAWNAIEGDLPTAIQASGDPFNPDVTPVKLQAHFTIPANDWRPEVELSWFQGGAMPEEPRKDLFRGIGHGTLFTGSDAWLISDYAGTHAIIPRDADPEQRFSRQAIKGKDSHIGLWIEACKNGSEPACNFDYGTKMIETMALGLVAYRAGKKLEYDASGGKITNDQAANEFLSKTYRDGWSLA